MGPNDKPILERIEKVLAELSRSIGLPDIDDNLARGPAIDVQSAVTRDGDPNDINKSAERLTIALSWVRARKARDDVLGEDLFFDPAWSILLELYLHHRQRTAVSITSLCASAGVSSSTGLRWVALLEGRGLVVRQPDPFDRRKVYAVLTEDAVQRIEEALDGATEANRHLGIG